MPRLGLTHEGILALLLIAEIAIFAIYGDNFGTRGNAFEIVRLSVELGLLALALTPVIVTGGIDLSVGSLMGLCAVMFGMMWSKAGWSIETAAALTLCVGACAGGLNALLITRFRLPPLIVTLGTFSLFRGLAEGLTGGTASYTGFPESFLFLGQGYFLGGIPAQLPIFVGVAAFFWFFLHRTTAGRALYAIGLSPEGARYAGIPVQRRIAIVYILTGVVVSLASIVYVARLGLAKADAGTGAELTAITAVVLGGTSIFGGRGTIHGTLLGLFAIVILQNGLLLAAIPAELAGILTGVLLLVTIGAGRLLALGRARAHPPISTRSLEGEFDVKNSQVAVLAFVILAGAAIVAGSNWVLVRGLVERTPAAGAPSTTSAANTRITIAMMPKSKGNAYFIACHKGAMEAAAELGVDLIWDGPTGSEPAKQNEIIETWITKGVDVIAVSVQNRDSISSVLRKARQKGIKVITWDADAEADSRDFFVNQATPEGIGQTLMDHAGRILGGKGDFAIITDSLGAANMIAWQKAIEARRVEKFPNIKMVDIRECLDNQSKAFAAAKTIMNAYPDVKLIMAICSPAVPGAAEAVKQAGRKDVTVIGLGLPNDNKTYVHEGITEAVVLWNTMDLGYLTVYASYGAKKGLLKPGDHNFKAGRLGEVEVQGDNVLLGTP
jgi:rhamnose transport system permease protein